MGYKLVKSDAQPDHEAEKTELDQDTERLDIAGGHEDSQRKISRGGL
jgi:hypothetical protein